MATLKVELRGESKLISTCLFLNGLAWSLLPSLFPRSSGLVLRIFGFPLGVEILEYPASVPSLVDGQFLIKYTVSQNNNFLEGEIRVSPLYNTWSGSCSLLSACFWLMLNLIGKQESRCRICLEGGGQWSVNGVIFGGRGSLASCPHLSPFLSIISASAG